MVRMRAEDRLAYPIRRTFPAGCPSAASGATVELRASTTASPIGEVLSFLRHELFCTPRPGRRAYSGC
jgi:hypothetical protein